MPSSTTTVLHIAIASPLRRLFDYLPAQAADSNIDDLIPGMRLAVPFGHQKALTGILISKSANSDTPINKLRPIHGAIDNIGLDEDILGLCQWCAQYYHYPLGEICHLALPTLLRKPEPAPPKTPVLIWQLTDKGRQCDEAFFGRAKKQFEAWKIAQEHSFITAKILKASSISRTIINTLVEKDILQCTDVALGDDSSTQGVNNQQATNHHNAHPLNNEQQHALDSIHFDGFHPYCLDGVTGSGKTEVYLQAISKVLEEGKQVLVLVPEIGLTPQTVERFEQRFTIAIATLHSGMSDKQRYETWLDAKEGRARIIIGTRSAIFTPLNNLGLIIIDEEHDQSYKQQEGVRYSAREVAIVRAQQKNIPIILGSATPSLETLHNAISGRYQHLKLSTRATNASMPTIQCIDSNQDDLAPEILQRIQQTLDQQQQVLVFINRRGYAPTLICQDCGWISQCNHCDSRMTLHNPKTSQPYLHCHHCDTKTVTPKQCPHCHSSKLQALGQGTQRSEEALSQRFKQSTNNQKNIPILRIDRDSMSRKGELEAALSLINTGEPCILIGTQMLAKGHHFPNVSLAVILGIDNSFFSSDFRGAERMGQLLTQVAGRAGREQHKGTVLLQTQFSEHPLLRTLIDKGYPALAEQLLAERQLTGMPPFQHLALIRCHAQQASMAINFLQQTRRNAEQLYPSTNSLQYLGPLPAVIEKRNNRYYYQLQIKAEKRSELHYVLQQLCPLLEKQKYPKGLHWLIDVDPQDT